MADLLGINIPAPVMPFTTEDDYATHDAKYGKGGWREMATVAAMQAIPAKRRSKGMRVEVTDDPETNNNGVYRYNGSIFEKITTDTVIVDPGTGSGSDFVLYPVINMFSSGELSPSSAGSHVIVYANCDNIYLDILDESTGELYPENAEYRITVMYNGNNFGAVFNEISKSFIGDSSSMILGGETVVLKRMSGNNWKIIRNEAAFHRDIVYIYNSTPIIPDYAGKFLKCFPSCAEIYLQLPDMNVYGSDYPRAFEIDISCGERTTSNDISVIIVPNAGEAWNLYSPGYPDFRYPSGSTLRLKYLGSSQWEICCIAPNSGSGSGSSDSGQVISVYASRSLDLSDIGGYLRCMASCDIIYLTLPSTVNDNLNWPIGASMKIRGVYGIGAVSAIVEPSYGVTVTYPSSGNGEIREGELGYLKRVGVDHWELSVTGSSGGGSSGSSDLNMTYIQYDYIANYSDFENNIVFKSTATEPTNFSITDQLNDVPAGKFIKIYNFGADVNIIGDRAIFPPNITTLPPRIRTGGSVNIVSQGNGYFDVVEGVDNARQVPGYLIVWTLFTRGSRNYKSASMQMGMGIKFLDESLGRINQRELVAYDDNGKIRLKTIDAIFDLGYDTIAYESLQNGSYMQNALVSPNGRYCVFINVYNDYVGITTFDLSLDGIPIVYENDLELSSYDLTSSVTQNNKMVLDDNNLYFMDNGSSNIYRLNYLAESDTATLVFSSPNKLLAMFLIGDIILLIPATWNVGYPDDPTYDKWIEFYNKNTFAKLGDLDRPTWAMESLDSFESIEGSDPPAPDLSKPIPMYIFSMQVGINRDRTRLIVPCYVFRPIATYENGTSEIVNHCSCNCLIYDTENLTLLTNKVIEESFDRSNNFLFLERPVANDDFSKIFIPSLSNENLLYDLSTDTVETMNFSSGAFNGGTGFLILGERLYCIFNYNGIGPPAGSRPYALGYIDLVSKENLETSEYELNYTEHAFNSRSCLLKLTRDPQSFIAPPP